jgi:hypothetical protein
MKIIFLDIDGVLVTENHLLSLQAQGKSMTDLNERVEQELYESSKTKSVKEINPFER